MSEAVFARRLTINALQLLFILTPVPQSSWILFETVRNCKSKLFFLLHLCFFPSHVTSPPESNHQHSGEARGRRGVWRGGEYLDGGGLLPSASDPSCRSMTGEENKSENTHINKRLTKESCSRFKKAAAIESEFQGITAAAARCNHCVTRLVGKSVFGVFWGFVSLGELHGKRAAQ